MHKDAAFDWQEVHQEAFDQLRDILCHVPVLALPDTTKGFVIETDWSQIGIGWTLFQEGEDSKLHPVQYGSRSLTKSEHGYAPTKGEFLGMFEGITHSRHNLLGAPFKARTDHKALVYLHNFRDLTGRTARMLEVMADYDFVIEYQPGKDMQATDALSRIPWDRMDCLPDHKSVPWNQLSREAETVAPIISSPIDWKAV
jgi:hypothetical protein